MISEFIAVLGKRSFARPTHFQVEITTVPATVSGAAGVSDFQRDMKFQCSGVDMPGTQILTQENRIYDLPQKFAYLKAHDEINLTVRVDRDYLSKKFFDAWVNSVYNKDTGNIHYKSDYIGQIKIAAMSDDGASPYVMVLEDCFPTQVGNLSYAWESTGTLLQFQVTLAFTRERIIAGEALFSANKDFTGNNNASDPLSQLQDNALSGAKVLMDEVKTSVGLDFDITKNEAVSSLKNSVYSNINNVVSDNITQKITMAAAQIDTSAIKKYFNF